MVGSRALLLAFVLAGCSANGRTETQENAMNSAVKLASSVEVEVGANTVRLVLHVTNPSNQPVTLEFASGQRYDFVVRTAAGEEVWRWSADQMFTQALGSQTINPGATVDFTETWNHGGRTGSFEAVASLKATNLSVEERAAFAIRK